MSMLGGVCFLLALWGLAAWPAPGGELSLESAAPVVVKTVPVAGSVGVDPALAELEVTFSKPMLDKSWSWSTWGENTFPEVTGKPRYLSDGRTCVLPVKLQPGRFYATWLNSEQFHGFCDTNNVPATPYLLTFETAGAGAGAASAAVSSMLNAEQRQVLEWTERTFRPFFEARSFDDWPEARRTALETRLLERLKRGEPRAEAAESLGTQPSGGSLGTLNAEEPGEDYYRAISSLASLRSTRAVAPLEAIAVDRREKDNRDRWMAVRALGLLGEQKVVPELVHLLYHFNANTRWWAQISLVRLTGVNFGKDWRAWGKWWNDQGRQPAFKPELVRWLDDPKWTDPDKLEHSLAAADREFFGSIKDR
jgi:RNA polymerase sigma-70 factor (ECF subfamily)